MEIVIKYHDNICRVIVIDDYKVSISQEDAGCKGKLSDDEPIELDQCKNCGEWKSVDEEMYGGGYCDNCAQICEGCDLYFNCKDMEQVSDYEYLCKGCAFPNNHKYQKAMDEMNEPDVSRGDVRVTFEYIGEGLSGDYTGEEDDVPQMRFYMHKKEDRPDGGGTDHPDWDWVEVEDGSYCTRVSVDTPNDVLEKLAWILLDRVEGRINAGDSIKKLGEELSWIDETCFFIPLRAKTALAIFLPSSYSFSPTKKVKTFCPSIWIAILFSLSFIIYHNKKPLVWIIRLTL